MSMLRARNVTRREHENDAGGEAAPSEASAAFNHHAYVIVMKLKLMARH